MTTPTITVPIELQHALEQLAVPCEENHPIGSNDPCPNPADWIVRYRFRRFPHAGKTVELLCTRCKDTWLQHFISCISCSSALAVSVEPLRTFR